MSEDRVLSPALGNLKTTPTSRWRRLSGIRSFVEPAVRFYNKCVLEPFTVEETAEYTHAVLGATSLNARKLAEGLFSGETREG